jgi:hypothetical protein
MPVGGSDAENSEGNCLVVGCAVYGRVSETPPQRTPDEIAAIIKVVTQCVAVIHAATPEYGMGEFYGRFDAYYNSSTGRVDNNVTTMGDQKAWFVFKNAWPKRDIPSVR